MDGFGRIISEMFPKRVISLSILIVIGVSPLWGRGRSLWMEVGGGPWLPMFGTFKSDHDPGLQGRIRIGYDGRFTVPQALQTWFPPLALFKDAYPFAEVYHSFNRLKTGTSGNLLFFGAGGRVLKNAGSFGYGGQMSLGFLYLYSSKSYQPAGILGIYGRWDLRSFYLYAEYSLETSVDLRSSYSVDTSLSFLQRTAGWHEAGVGIGMRW